MKLESRMLLARGLNYSSMQTNSHDGPAMYSQACMEFSRGDAAGNAFHLELLKLAVNPEASLDAPSHRAAATELYVCCQAEEGLPPVFHGSQNR